MNHGMRIACLLRYRSGRGIMRALGVAMCARGYRVVTHESM